MSRLRPDMLRMARRNRLVGMWAAEQLGLDCESAKVYANDLAMGALEVDRNDVLAILRRDFDAAGVIQSDEQILSIMSQSWIDAGRGTRTAEASDTAVVQIVRSLQSR